MSDFVFDLEEGLLTEFPRTTPVNFGDSEPVIQGPISVFAMLGNELDKYYEILLSNQDIYSQYVDPVFEAMLDAEKPLSAENPEILNEQIEQLAVPYEAISPENFKTTVLCILLDQMLADADIYQGPLGEEQISPEFIAECDILVSNLPVKNNSYAAENSSFKR